MAAQRDAEIDRGRANPRARRGGIEVAAGLALIALGMLFRSSELASYALWSIGGLVVAHAIWGLVRDRLAYKSFVARRYLVDARTKVTPATSWRLVAGLALTGLLVLLRVGVGAPETGLDRLLGAAALAAGGFTFVVIVWGVLRHAQLAMIVFLVGVALTGLSIAATRLAALPRLLVHLDPETVTLVLQISNATAIVGAVLAGLAMLFGVLRAYFTFFTTVPIGGVWIGTTALVIVLAVMSGFESDLRQKILGSNAHIQITREDGEFTEWRDVQAQLDRLPGVVASTPFAVSEVVVAANNQGMNVIIKGIDPDTVGQVTDLVSDLDDREAIKRLAPLVQGAHDLRVPQPAGAGVSTGAVIDPPPDDMPARGEPIDFSGPVPVPPGSGADPGGAAAPVHSDGTPPGRAGVAPFGGDAHDLLDLDDPPRSAPHPVIDPPPPDLLTTDEPPADYGRPDYEPESVVKVVDILPFDAPSLSRRTQSLPGILVGRELVKQTHLYTGEEVRVVSPLSDPSNPDATGTPIPFNRDYRVAGIFYTGMYEYDLKYVYVTLDSLQDFLDRGDAVDGIEVRINNPDNTDAFVAGFAAKFGPQYRVQDWKELNRSLFSALKLEKIAMFLVLGIVILVASFSIVGNLIMVVVEKAREIALLKTLGASDVGVMQLFAIQGLMIGVIGTALGIATGLAGCWAGKRFGLPLNPDVYYIDRLPIHVDPMSVVAAASAGILISIAATVYPAVVAARVRPAAGMRH
jgi:lipoprotein-releasing system permease protein